MSARVLRFEGHYLADGTGYAYYGLAPLLPRFALGWLLPTDGTVFPYLLLMSCAVASSAMIHRMVHDEAVRAGAERGLLVRLGIACWLAAPGIMMVPNKSVYWEPIAVGFTCVILFFFALHRWRRQRWPVGRVLWVGGLAAAVALHARPHMAAAICLGLAIVGVTAIVRRRGWLLPSLVGAGLVAASAAGLVLVNQAKFGDAGTAHASFSREAPVQYGTVFFRVEAEDSDRARAFEEHGRFALTRIPGGLIAHAIQFNLSPLTLAAVRVLKLGEPLHGFSRLEFPLMGFLFLFTPWIAIAAMGAKRGRPDPASAAMLAAGALAAIAVLAYPTITFRYRAELFPILFALALVALPTFVARQQGERRDRRLLFMVALWIGVIFTSTTAYSSHKGLLAGGVWGPWSMDQCLGWTQRAGLDGDEAQRSCDP